MLSPSRGPLGTRAIQANTWSRRSGQFVTINPEEIQCLNCVFFHSVTSLIENHIQSGRESTRARIEYTKKVIPEYDRKVATETSEFPLLYIEFARKSLFKESKNHFPLLCFPHLTIAVNHRDPSLMPYRKKVLIPKRNNQQQRRKQKLSFPSTKSTKFRPKPRLQFKQCRRTKLKWKWWKKWLFKFQKCLSI